MGNEQDEDVEYWKKKYYDYVEYMDSFLDRMMIKLSELQKSQEETKKMLDSLEEKLGINSKQ